MICTVRRKSALLATNNRVEKPQTGRRNFILKEEGEVYAARNAFFD